MDKMFKRTLLGAAVAAAGFAGSANAAIPLAGDAVQFYGQAAGYMMLMDDSDTTSLNADIESRIGFRGIVEFDDISPNFIWQMEGGNANNGDKTGGLGARDTYLGLEFEGVGQFKYGRQLVAAYNYVDWPHSNPGLGNVFDWNNDIEGGYQDRADSVLRFDSANFGGFNFQATLSGMSKDVDQMVASFGTSFTKDMFSIHGGYYTQDSYEQTTEDDTVETVDSRNYAIVGGSVFLGDLTLTAAYKAMEVGDASQNAYSTTAQYVIDSKYVLKAGYAATDDADGVEGTDTADQAVTARFGYLLPSSYWYIDSRNYSMNGGDWSNRVLVGMEYYF